MERENPVEEIQYQIDTDLEEIEKIRKIELVKLELETKREEAKLGIETRRNDIQLNRDFYNGFQPMIWLAGLVTAFIIIVFGTKLMLSYGIKIRRQYLNETENRNNLRRNNTSRTNETGSQLIC